MFNPRNSARDQSDLVPVSQKETAKRKAVQEGLCSWPHSLLVMEVSG